MRLFEALPSRQPNHFSHHAGAAGSASICHICTHGFNYHSFVVLFGSSIKSGINGTRGHFIHVVCALQD